MVEILGIVNVTRDSFSDGGRYLEPAVALDRAHGLVADGAAIVDVGAASTHPDSEEVTETEELRRIEPVVGEAHPLHTRGQAGAHVAGGAGRR